MTEDRIKVFEAMSASCHNCTFAAVIGGSVMLIAFVCTKMGMTFEQAGEVGKRLHDVINEAVAQLLSKEAQDENL